MQSDKDNWLAKNSSSFRAVSSFFHSLQYTAITCQLKNFKKFDCNKIIIGSLKIIPEIKSVICFYPPPDFQTHQCCLYSDGKKLEKPNTVFLPRLNMTHS